MSKDILADIDDLIQQATTERSHHYTASVLKRARAEIERLRKIEAVREAEWAESELRK